MHPFPTWKTQPKPFYAQGQVLGLWLLAFGLWLLAVGLKSLRFLGIIWLSILALVADGGDDDGGAGQDEQEG